MYLLDTCVLIWSLSDPSRLSRAAAERIENASEEIAYYQASLWEVQIKRTLGKIRLEVSVEEIERHCVKVGFDFLPVSNGAIYMLERLPMLHRDPFDRILVAEAIYGQHVLISADEKIQRYPVKTLW